MSPEGEAGVSSLRLPVGDLENQGSSGRREGFKNQSGDLATGPWCLMAGPPEQPCVAHRQLVGCC